MLSLIKEGLKTHSWWHVGVSNSSKLRFLNTLDTTGVIWYQFFKESILMAKIPFQEDYSFPRCLNMPTLHHDVHSGLYKYTLYTGLFKGNTIGKGGVTRKLCSLSNLYGREQVSMTAPLTSWG